MHFSLNRTFFFETCSKSLIFAVFSVVFAFSAFSEKYVLGGANGWNDVNVRNGITTGKGRFGYESLQLATNSNILNEDTDLLLDFEDKDFEDRTGKYTVVENSLFDSKKAIHGKKSALSRKRPNGLVLRGNKNSLFGGEGPAGSFSIEFWICPYTVENGETLINWRSSRNLESQIVYQIVNFSFYQNKMLVTFSNIFDGYTKNNGDVNLLTNRRIMPGKWSHHFITFQEETGILEYRIDGELECIKFITETEHEGGTVFPAVMGICADLELCPSYTGLIDDVKISRSFSSSFEPYLTENGKSLAQELYPTRGGRFESVPILTKPGTVVNSMTVESDIPEQTEIQFYIRSGDNRFNWTSDFPEWKAVAPGQKIDGVSGMYFQVAANLFPDGMGKKTPSVTSIELDYTVLADPLAPFRISAQKGDKSVKLSWSYSVDDTAGGYLIFYGTHPGEYLGRNAVQGESPIDVGNVTDYTITGLENGTIYYFAISAYSKIDSRIVGPLSTEVFARPSAK